MSDVAKVLADIERGDRHAAGQLLPLVYDELRRLAAALVQLRAFAGLTLAQAAEALGIGRRTADRDWAYARAWLCHALTGPDRPGEAGENPADPGAPGPRTEH